MLNSTNRVSQIVTFSVNIWLNLVWFKVRVDSLHCAGQAQKPEEWGVSIPDTPNHALIAPTP